MLPARRLPQRGDHLGNQAQRDDATDEERQRVIGGAGDGVLYALEERVGLEGHPGRLACREAGKEAASDGGVHPSDASFARNVLPSLLPAGLVYDKGCWTHSHAAAEAG